MNKTKIIFQEHIDLATETLKSLSKKIDFCSDRILSCLKNKNKIIFFGNGGSASDAQHLSAEFVGRFLKEREPLPSISLSTDTSIITAIANDYGYENIFERQIKAIANKGDVLVGISTSGNSLNVIKGFKVAKVMGLETIALLGNDGGKIVNIVKNSIVVPSNSTARIQEIHILIGHIFCEYVDDNL